LSEEEQERLDAEFSMLVEDGPWVTGALDLIATYCHRIPLHIASATPADELLRILSRLGVRPFFQEVGGVPQPKGEILQQINIAVDYDPERLLVVGDALSDFEGTLEVGATFLGWVDKDSINPFPKSVQTVEDLNQLVACLYT
jgi:phosphoglycolate phosphatase-like HAD superfamily hydrolase